MVKIHLERPSKLVSGGNASLLADAGDGVEYNAYMATALPGDTTEYFFPAFFVGPRVSDSSYGDRPRIGEFVFLCGFNADDTKQFPTNADVTDGPIEGLTICPKSKGIYDIYSMFANWGPKNKVINGWKVERVKYSYFPASIVGEVRSGSSLTWSRSAGTMSLHVINCKVTCGGETLPWTRRLVTTLSAGKDYYIRLSPILDHQIEISDKPFD